MPSTLNWDQVRVMLECALEREHPGCTGGEIRFLHPKTGCKGKIPLTLAGPPRPAICADCVARPICPDAVCAEVTACADVTLDDAGKDEGPADLTERERAAMAVFRQTGPGVGFTAEALADRLGCECNSRFRGILTNLSRRGLIRPTPRHGYFLQEK